MKAVKLLTVVVIISASFSAFASVPAFNTRDTNVKFKTLPCGKRIALDDINANTNPTVASSTKTTDYRTAVGQDNIRK